MRVCVVFSARTHPGPSCSQEPVPSGTDVESYHGHGELGGRGPDTLTRVRVEGTGPLCGQGLYEPLKDEPEVHSVLNLAR